MHCVHALKNTPIKFNWHSKMKIFFEIVFFSSACFFSLATCASSFLFGSGLLVFFPEFCRVQVSIIVISNWLRLIFIFNIFQLLCADSVLMRFLFFERLHARARAHARLTKWQNKYHFNAYNKQMIFGTAVLLAKYLNQIVKMTK